MYIDPELAFNAVSTTAGVITLTPQDETTTSATPYDSDSIIDLTHVPRNVLTPLYLVVQIIVVPVSAGGGTLTISLVTSAAEALTTPTILWSSGLLANATIVAYTAYSTIFTVGINLTSALRYLGVNYTIGTADLTAGSWIAFLTPDAPFAIAATP